MSSRVGRHDKTGENSTPTNGEDSTPAHSSFLVSAIQMFWSARLAWHRLRGYNQLPKIIVGVKFNDGVEVVRPQAQTAAA
jgi:hypothetical protein